MTVTVLVVGRATSSFRHGIEDFEARAAHYWKLRVIEVAAGPSGKGRGDPARAMAGEQERILAKVSDRAEVVALTRTGTAMTSPEFASYLGRLTVHSTPEVTFIVGGAFGLGEGVLQRADRSLALSSGTLPHELARLVLAEQLYRAGTILRNEPYHKGGT